MSGDLFDVAVVGGGGGGLAASISASQCGRTVVLLEKGSECGGNTARSISSVPGAGTRFQKEASISDSASLFCADIASLTGDLYNESALRRLAGLSAELVHWLVDHVGVSLSLTEDYRHVGHTVNRLHNPPYREGKELVVALVKAAIANGVAIMVNSAVESVSRTDDGFELITSDRRKFGAKRVVLAADGFGGSPELVGRYCREYSRLPYLGSPENVGDGMRLGTALGGSVGSMSAILGYAIMGLPDRGQSSWETMISWTVVEKGGVIVDHDGSRFANEEVGYSAFVDAVVAHTNDPVYVVFDRRILETVSQYEQRFKLLVERNDSPIKPFTSERGSAPFGLDPLALQRTINEYNKAASRHGNDPFGRIDFGMAPMLPELFVGRGEPAILTTLGGLRVGPNAEVLDGDGRPIPSVYAAGGTAETISGVNGARGYSSGCGLLAALGYGYLAGRAAASEGG